jgi:hypothetical protein
MCNQCNENEWKQKGGHNKVELVLFHKIPIPTGVYQHFRGNDPEILLTNARKISYFFTLTM